jgi:hypothetical protein
VTEQPERGGAWDFGGQVRPEYSPRRDASPDPGEVVWAWIPFDEDPRVGKDRPLLVIGRDVADKRVFIGLMLSSKDHAGHPSWYPVGAGPWDRENRPSWVRLDRLLAVREDAVRREGAALPPQTFHSVVDRALSGTRSFASADDVVPQRRGGLLARLKGLVRH